MQKFSWLGIASVLFLAIALRLPEVGLIKCDYLSDCGRDLLAAKHIADGTASIWTSPISAISILPNTPLYYWILAGFYRLGGLLAISYFNLFAGVMAVWMVYQIVLELTNDKLHSWFAGVIVAVLPDMINASTMTWQPHWEYLFGGVSIWLCLRALRAKNLTWHYLATISLTPLIYQEYLALPVAGIMTLWLAWSGWQISKREKKLHKKFGLSIALVATWAVWIGLLLWLMPGDGGVVFKNLVASQEFSISTQFTKATDLAKVFVNFFSDSSHYFLFWFWLLPAPIFAALYRWDDTSDPVEKKQIGFLVTLFSPVILVFIDPGGSVSGWHFLLQGYVLFLCLVLIPHYFQFSRPVKLGFLVALLCLLQYQNRFRHEPLFMSRAASMRHAGVLAKFIVKDIKAQGIAPTQFRLMQKNKRTPDWIRNTSNNLDDSALDYTTAGVQLALELHDPAYAPRVKVVPIHEWWSNYLQPFSQTYYIICSNYGADEANKCVDELFFTDYVLSQKAYLGIVRINTSESFHIFRLQLLPVEPAAQQNP